MWRIADLCRKSVIRPTHRSTGSGIFSELQSHYLFADHFGRPGKGNDKGKVEGLVGYARRNFMVPIPHAAGFAELNAQLLACCRRRSATDPQYLFIKPSRRRRGHRSALGADDAGGL